MSFIGKAPKLNSTKYTPQSADPVNPTDGQVFKSDGTVRPAGLWIYNGTDWEQVGTGAGAKNFIKNPDANTNANDTSAGTGLTLARNTTTPLEGSGDFQLDKDAADRSGQVFTFDMDNVDSYLQSKQVLVSFPYSTGAGYVSDDINVILYDITNSKEIRAVANTGLKANSSGSFAQAYQLSADSVDYELRLKVISTNATAYTIKMDNVKVSELTFENKSAFVSDSEYFTVTFNNFSASSSSGVYKRNGEYADIEVYAVSSGAVTGSLEVNLPSELEINTDKMVSVVDSAVIIGSASATDSGVGYHGGQVVYRNINTVRIQNDDGGSLWGASSPMTWASGDIISIKFSVPIKGWSLGVTPDQVAVNQIPQYGNVYASTLQSIPHNVVTKVTFDTESVVNGLTYDSVNNRFVITQDGFYNIGSQIDIASNGAGTTRQIRILKNGSLFAIEKEQPNTTVTECTIDVSKPDYHLKDDYFEVFVFQDSGVSLNANVNPNLTGFFYAYKAQNPAEVISAGDTVAAKVYSTNTQSISNNTTTQITYNNSVFDTHGSMNAGVFTAPIDGIYSFSAIGQLSQQRFEAGEVISFSGFKEGALYARTTLEFSAQNTTFDGTVILNGLVELVKGETFDIRIYHNTGSVPSIRSSSNTNTFAIHKI